MERQRHSEEIYLITKKKCDELDYTKLKSELEQQTKSRKAVDLNGQLQVNTKRTWSTTPVPDLASKTASTCL